MTVGADSPGNRPMTSFCGLSPAMASVVEIRPRRVKRTAAKRFVQVLIIVALISASLCKKIVGRFGDRIGGEDPRLGFGVETTGRAVEHDAAAVDADDAAGQRAGQRDLMQHQHHGHAVAGRSVEDIERAYKMPRRAPLVIVVVAKARKSEIVTPFEQQLTAGCAVMAMQMAAVALGFAGVWRSGWQMCDLHLACAFQLGDNDRIVGFLYLGTAAKTPNPPPEAKPADFVRAL
jgi:nitroreductase